MIHAVVKNQETYSKVPSQGGFSAGSKALEGFQSGTGFFQNLWEVRVSEIRGHPWTVCAKVPSGGQEAARLSVALLPQLWLSRVCGARGCASGQVVAIAQTLDFAHCLLQQPEDGFCTVGSS